MRSKYSGKHSVRLYPCERQQVFFDALSREVVRFNEILKVLSLYRLAFGQPMQEELILNLLHRNFNDDDIRKITKFLVINLAPLKKVTEDEILPRLQNIITENRAEVVAVN